MSDSCQEKLPFWCRPKAAVWLTRILIGFAIFSVIGNVFLPGITSQSISSWPGFYAVVGVLASAFVVLVASLLKTYIWRKENFYD